MRIEISVVFEPGYALLKINPCTYRVEDLDECANSIIYFQLLH